MSTLEVLDDTNVKVGSSGETIIVTLDEEVTVIQTFEQGPPGPPGPEGPQSIQPGPPGPAGNTVLYGNVDPTNLIGVNGDFYINNTTHFIFGPKVSGAWPPGISMVGPQGIKGDPGAAGNTVLYGPADPVAGQGVDGNFYINTSTHFLFGPKAGGAWPAGITLVGPQGPQGVTGSEGPTGGFGPQGPIGPQGIQGPPGEVPEAPLDGKLYGRKAAAWAEVLGAALLVSDTPPAGAPAGTLWFESDSGLLYLNFFDGSSTQWVIACPQPDLSAFVGKYGDTMLGPLTIKSSGADAAFTLDKPSGSYNNAIYGRANGTLRWMMAMGDASAESGGNVGSDFAIGRFNDAGGVTGYPISIKRSTGAVTINGDLIGGGRYLTELKGNKFGSAFGAAYNTVVTQVDANVLLYDYGALNWSGMGSDALGNFWLRVSSGAAVKPAFWITAAGPQRAAFNVPLDINGQGGDAALSLCDSTQTPRGMVLWQGSTGGVILYNTASVNNQLIIGNGNSYGINLGQGFWSKNGISGSYTAYSHNFSYSGVNGQITAWVDASNIGVVSIASDYRTKKDVADLPGMWETVKALRPIKYTQKEFSPPSHAEHMAARAVLAKTDETTSQPGHLFLDDDTERWGFVAHELQETLVESAATGVKDSPDTVQSPNPFTVIAALTKALQEAMARIETLEAKVNA